MFYEIIVDAKETPNKCTIAPLAARVDFRLFPVFGEGPIGPLSAPILLHHEGECLLTLRPQFPKASAIAGVDSVWRRLPKITGRIAWEGNRAPRLARIPGGFRTVYPRVGQPKHDPDGGLATIEALFIGAALLGNWDPTLLERYYFGRKFVEVNATRFLELGLAQAADPAQWPVPLPPARDSYTRRLNRGRGPKT